MVDLMSNRMSRVDEMKANLKNLAEAEPDRKPTPPIPTVLVAPIDEPLRLVVAPYNEEVISNNDHAEVDRTNSSPPATGRELNVTTPRPIEYSAPRDAIMTVKESEALADAPIQIEESEIDPKRAVAAPTVGTPVPAPKSYDVFDDKPKAEATWRTQGIVVHDADYLRLDAIESFMKKAGKIKGRRGVGLSLCLGAGLAELDRLRQTDPDRLITLLATAKYNRKSGS